MVVVLPAPFTPITSTTDGFVERSSFLSSPSISVMMAFSSSFMSIGSVMPFSLTFFLSSAQISTEVCTPISHIIRVSSSSSKKSSSILVNEFIRELTLLIIESLVFLMPSAILSKNPIYDSLLEIVQQRTHIYLSYIINKKPLLLVNFLLTKVLSGNYFFY